MTQQKIITVNCPACLEDSNFKIFSHIDGNQNRELKEKIFSREIFKFACPKCGEEILVAYDCTYTDDSGKFVVALISGADEVSSNLTVDGYKFRIVRSINEFVEKIAAFEDEIDDKVIELYKIMIEEQFEDERPDAKILGIYYGGKDFSQNSLLFFVITENAENCRAYLSMDTYETIAKQFSSASQKYADASEINKLWAIGVLQDGFEEK